MKTTSIWEASAGAAENYPSFAGNAEADVVIIGGGISGIMAASLLAKAGKRVIVLEAHRIGLGTTGNSTGNLYVTIDEHLHHLKKKWNADVVKKVVASRKEAIDFIESQVQQNNIDCDFIRSDFKQYSETEDKACFDFIDQELEAMREAGLNPSVLEGGTKPFKHGRTLVLPNQAQFHPLKYVRALARSIGGNCSIFENSAMTEYDGETGLVKTAGGEIKARNIIMATHMPKGFFVVQTVLGPYREFGISAELKDSDMGPGIYWSIEKPKHSIRIMNHGDKKYIIAVGDKFKTGQHKDTVPFIKGLDEYLRQRFNMGPIQHVWAGQQYKPADCLPYIGQNNDRLYYMTGFSTDGLVYGTLGAMIISDLIQGKENQWFSLYDSSRHTPLRSAKAFVKENMNNASQYIDLLPGRVEARTLDEVKPGEGKVMEVEGKKLAVYRDEKHQCHVVSAICPHLFCVVNWNGSEKSWDCPCHGSRFTTSGEVIEGPAISNLPKKEI